MTDCVVAVLVVASNLHNRLATHQANPVADTPPPPPPPSYPRPHRLLCRRPLASFQLKSCCTVGCLPAATCCSNSDCIVQPVPNSANRSTKQNNNNNSNDRITYDLFNLLLVRRFTHLTIKVPLATLTIIANMLLPLLPPFLSLPHFVYHSHINLSLCFFFGNIICHFG